MCSGNPGGGEEKLRNLISGVKQSKGGVYRFQDCNLNEKVLGKELAAAWT